MVQHALPVPPPVRVGAVGNLSRPEGQQHDIRPPGNDNLAGRHPGPDVIGDAPADLADHEAVEHRDQPRLLDVRHLGDDGNAASQPMATNRRS